MTIANEFSDNELKMDSSTKLQYSAISKHSSVTGTPDDIEAWLTSLPLDSHASRSVSREKEKGKTTLETCGLKPSSASAWYDRDTHCWRTYQLSLLTNTCEPFSGKFAKAGMIAGGVYYRRQKRERRIDGIDCGSSVWIGTPTAEMTPRSKRFMDANIPNPAEYVEKFPTPTVNGNYNRKGVSKTSGDGLATYVKRMPFATPSAADAVGSHGGGQGRSLRTDIAEWKKQQNNLNDQIGGQLNPTWVEWLMGFPIGWTDSRPLETDKFQQWWLAFSKC
jgi:hypothetical protein